uniref:Zgc:174906 n=1 Tax=Cyprinodon variegatus TaxID=28743 RepID=A0A3Q2CX00_CYPVA
MAEEAADVVQLLKRHKAKLIKILSSDADFVLQSAHSCDLPSDQGYERIKSCRVPSEKVRDLLDHVILRGPKAARGMLDLLQEQDMQETFPMLAFVKDLHVKTPLSVQESESEDQIPTKKVRPNGCCKVTEKQLMKVARGIGSSWREIGRLALDIPSVRLEQFEEETRIHVERVFAMLRYWRNQKREEATAAYLHSLLSQNDLGVPSESIDFLLEND